MNKIFDVQDDSLLTERQAADLLSISSRTLQAWRTKEIGPAYARVGRVIRYQRSELINWVKHNTFRSEGA